jgi:hypothetical protein
MQAALDGIGNRINRLTKCTSAIESVRSDEASEWASRKLVRTCLDCEEPANRPYRDK